jgi:hypothetical protein
LVGKPEGKRTFGKPRHRWEDCVKMDLNEVGREVVDWIHLTRNKDGKAFSGSIKSGKFLDYLNTF